MKSIRRLHGWLGVLFAPSIILFALTGMLQLYELHDVEPGEQPGLVAKLAMIHTHQTASVPVRAPRPQPAQPPQPQPERPKQEKHSTMPLKLLFTAMALALMTSSVLGVWIAFTTKRDRNLHIGLLAAGVVLPVVLLIV